VNEAVLRAERPLSAREGAFLPGAESLSLRSHVLSLLSRAAIKFGAELGARVALKLRERGATALLERVSRGTPA